MRPAQILPMVVLAIVSGCSQEAPTRAPSGNVDTGRIIGADAEPESWLSHGRTYSEQRYSPLDQINRTSVQDLALAWAFDMNSSRGLEASPIVVDGAMFVTGAWSIKAVWVIPGSYGGHNWLPAGYSGRYIGCPLLLMSRTCSAKSSPVEVSSASGNSWLKSRM